MLLGLYAFEAFRKRESPYLEMLAEFSLFVAAAVATHLLYRYFEEGERLNEIRVTINETANRILEGTVAASASTGLAGFEKQLNFGDLFDSLEAGDELLWLDTFAQNYTVFLPKLRMALGRGCKIRMLVIHPKCDNAVWRARELADGGFREPERFSNQIELFVAAVLDVAKEAEGLPGSIELRVYRDLPCVPLYLFKRNGGLARGYSSFFFHRPTDGYFHICWRYSPAGFLRDAAEYFERKWEANAKNAVWPVSLDAETADDVWLTSLNRAGAIPGRPCR